MRRRAFLAAAAATTLVRRDLPAAEPRPFVPSDFAPLKRVLIHNPGPEARKLPPEGEENHPFTPYYLGDVGVKQHDRFVDRLEAMGVVTVAFGPLLAEAIRRCREAGAFRPWLMAELPHLVDREAQIDESVLIGSDDAFLYHKDAEGRPAPLVHPLKCLFFTRDIGVMTPRGLILSRFINADRALEPALLRLTLRWSPELSKYPIAFDARAEGVDLQGGDLTVLDDRTLLVGVGNLTDEAAAPRLARRLDMDVLTVRLPGLPRSRRGSPHTGALGDANDWDEYRTLFLHLDSAFTLVGPKLALAAPYLFEAKYHTPEVHAAFARALGKSPRTARRLFGVGSVRLYKARSGKPDPAVKGGLVEELRKRGFDFIHVGGEQTEEIDEVHLREIVVHELSGQGANVVAVAPNRVIAYADNIHTIRALEAHGVHVTPTAGEGLLLWHGGPHCMTLPLERRDG